MSDLILPDTRLQTKRCSKCNRDLPLLSFHKNRRKKDGLHYYCKECMTEHGREYRQANKDKIAKYMSKNYQANKEVIAERRRNRNQANKEKNKEYRQANKEKITEFMREYYQANRGEILEHKRKYNLAHPEIRKANDHRRRARKSNASGSHTAQDIRDLFSLQKGKCTICHKSIKKGYHIDHVIPLSRGGSNHKHNIQLLCPSCNVRKNAKDPVIFMRQQGFLL